MSCLKRRRLGRFSLNMLSNTRNLAHLGENRVRLSERLFEPSPASMDCTAMAAKISSWGAHTPHFSTGKIKHGKEADCAKLVVRLDGT